MIAGLRAELVALLGELGTVHRTVPEALTPPCIVIQPAESFVVDDDPDRTFGEPYAISFDVILLVPLDGENDNEQASDQLDALLDGLLDTLRLSDWWIHGMGQPGPLQTTDWIEHGQRVTVRRRVQL